MLRRRDVFEQCDVLGFRIGIADNAFQHLEQHKAGPSQIRQTVTIFECSFAHEKFLAELEPKRS